VTFLAAQAQLLCGSLPKRVAEIAFVRARIADAHRDGQRFIVRADEILTAFGELQTAIHERKSISPAARR
jgi:hypothetical protein